MMRYFTTRQGYCSVLFGAIAVLAACSGRRATFTLEELEGVRYVHNHAPAHGEVPGLGLELAKTIGSTETDDDRYLLLLPLDVVAGGAPEQNARAA